MKDGEFPPGEALFDYKRPLKDLNDPIPFKYCGKNHRNGLTDTVNYTHTYWDICYECFIKKSFAHKPVTEKIVINEDGE